MLRDGETTILIDGGYPTGDSSGVNREIEYKVFSYLDYHNINHIDYYVISHYHADHFGIASKILEVYKPERIFIPFSLEDGKLYVENIDLPNEETVFGSSCKQCFYEFYDTIIKNRLENNLVVVNHSVNSDCIIPFKDSVFTLYNPINDDLTVKSNLNNKSAMFFTLIGEQSNAFIFSDTEANSNKKVREILSALKNYKFHIIKLPHHGDFSSKYFNEDFFTQRKNEIMTVLVSGGINRYFGFNTSDSSDLDRFSKKYRIQTLLTYKDGDITIDLSTGYEP